MPPGSDIPDEQLYARPPPDSRSPRGWLVDLINRLINDINNFYFLYFMYNIFNFIFFIDLAVLMDLKFYSPDFKTAEI